MKLRRILKRSVGAILLGLFLWFFIAYWSSTNECSRNAAASNNPMKAIRYCEYGAPDDVLKLEEVEKPVPKDNEILVRVRAVSLIFFDGDNVARRCWQAHLWTSKAEEHLPWIATSPGRVEAVGKNVTEFKPGDKVLGTKLGAVAEYVCVLDQRVVAKPTNVTFEQAAAVPLAGLTALQGVKKGNIQPGQKVLINGASGGVVPSHCRSPRLSALRSRRCAVRAM